MGSEGLAAENTDKILDLAMRRGEVRGEGTAAEKPTPEVTKPSPPDPEVAEKPVRRTFPAEYKRRILREADTCADGELGSMLRREGLYFSHLTTWRRQREQGELDALGPKKRGRKGKERNPLAKRVAELERENRRLQKRLEKAEVIIDVQKKIAGLLGIPLKNPDEEGSD
jgi:transposase-like protein